MGLGYYHFKMYAPYGLDQRTNNFMKNIVTDANDEEPFSFGHLMSQILTQPYDSLEFPFGAVFLGWAQSDYSYELKEILVKVQGLTICSGNDLVASEGASQSIEDGDIQFLYAFPLLDLSSAQVASQFREISPLKNNERTLKILEWCYR